MSVVKEDKFFRQVLPNGLKVIFEKRDVPLVVTMAATRFGSGYEDPKIKGIAHLIEHTVFKRTKTKTADQIAALIENKGGDINAFTGQEITAYHSKLGADNFEVGMDVVSDIMLNPVFNKKDIDKEKKVVLQEMKMYHDAPKRFVSEKLFEQIYAPPFGLSGIGTPETLKRITRAAMQKYHGIYYSPSNIVVSVVGKADVDHIWNLSRKYFLKKQVQRQINKMQKLSVKPGSFGNFIEHRKGIDQAHLSFGYLMPSLQSPLRYAAEIFNNIFGELSFTSRLYQEIRERRGLAYHAYSSVNQEVDYSYGEIYIGTEKSKLESSKKIALKELKKMEKVDLKDVNESKERLIGKFALRGEDSENVAYDLLQEELNGDGKEYYKYPARISEVKLEDVRKVAKIAQIASAMILPEN